MLQRTQILLDSETKRDLIYLSELTDRSMSDLVREFVAEKVKVEKKKVSLKKGKKQTSGAQALLKLAQEAEKVDKKYGYEGPTDWSINHDHYLYGLPKKKIK